MYAFGGLAGAEQAVAGGGDAVAQVGDAEQLAQPAGLEVELHLVAGVQQEEVDLGNPVLVPLGKPQEALVVHARVADLQQPPNLGRALAEEAQHPGVQLGGQQVEVGQPPQDGAAANLLVPGKGRQPRGEAHEDHAAGLQEAAQVPQQLALVGDVLQRIAQDDEVELPQLLGPHVVDVPGEQRQVSL